jgi:transposase
MRYELTDHEWSAIKPMLPNKVRGVPRVNDRRVLNAIFWVLRSGAPWRDLPNSFGPYTTCYNRFVATKKRARANIPPKSNRNDPICFGRYLYRARDLVGRLFNKIKQCRRVATR